MSQCAILSGTVNFPDFDLLGSFSGITIKKCNTSLSFSKCFWCVVRARQKKERVEQREYEASRIIQERMDHFFIARKAFAGLPAPETTLVQESEIEEEEEAIAPPLPAVLENSAPATVADEAKGTVALAGSRAAATAVTTPASAEVSSLPEISAEGAEAAVATAGFGVPFEEQVGEEVKDEDMVVPAASQAVVPGSDFDGASDSFSRALSGVQGFDLDALDLEMDDLRPEDLEVGFSIWKGVS